MLLQIVAIMLSLSFCCVIVGAQVFELFPSSVMPPHCRYGGQSSVPTFGYDITLPCNICSISIFNHAATTLLPCMFLFCFYAGSCAVILLPIFFLRFSVALEIFVFTITFVVILSPFHFQLCSPDSVAKGFYHRHAVATGKFSQSILPSHCIDVSITAFVRFSSAILLYS